MRPPSQQLRFPIGLAAAVVIAMLTAAVLTGSGLVIGVLLFVAITIVFYGRRVLDRVGDFVLVSRHHAAGLFECIDS